MLYSFDTHLTRTKEVPSPTDEELMAAIQEEKPEALETLYLRHGTLLKSAVTKIIHDEHAAEDLLQEVFLEIWRLAKRYSPEKGLALGWMMTLTRRRAIDRLRKFQAYHRAEERLSHEKEQQPEAWTHNRSTVDEDMAASDIREILQRIMNTLPPAQQDAVHLAFYEGMSQREIAAHTRTPLGTIKTRLELGLRKINTALRQMTGEVEPTIFFGRCS